MQSKPPAAPPGRAPPSTATASTSAVETVEGTHVFHVCGYSLVRRTGVGSFVQSGVFPVGGRLWSVRFYPGSDDGAGAGGQRDNDSRGCCWFRLELMTQGPDARACFTVGLANQADGSTSWEATTPLIAFSAADRAPTPSRLVVRRSRVEDFAVLRGDRVSIVCAVGVVVDPRVSPAAPAPRVHVPPPDLPSCLGRLLEEGEETDVTLHVGEETFAAHGILLAARSPVLKAQLYGPMREKEKRGDLRVTVEDTQPAVFRALLRFIYTDSLPAMDGLVAHDRKEMVRHLLVAADRYAMERLKTICQGILCKNLTVHTVVDMLAFADQYHCGMLKDACFEFIFAPNRLNDVIASHGYAKLKETCPSVLVEVLEKSSKFQKM